MSVLIVDDDAASATRSPNLRIQSHTTLDVKPLGAKRFKADISYLDKQGRIQTRSRVCTQEEIRNWNRNLPDASGDELARLLQALDLVGRPWVMPAPPNVPQDFKR